MFDTCMLSQGNIQFRSWGEMSFISQKLIVFFILYTLQTDCSTLQSREEFIFSAFKINYCCDSKMYLERLELNPSLCGIIPFNPCNFSLINRVAEFNRWLVILTLEHKLSFGFYDQTGTVRFFVFFLDSLPCHVHSALSSPLLHPPFSCSVKCE